MLPLALMGMPLMLTSILRRYRIRPAPGSPPPGIRALTSLRTRHGLHLALERRLA
jgi:cytochrome P450